MNKYLFILCPPYSGSTLLTKILGTSPETSLLPKEGQWLPEVMDDMRREVWSEERVMPWEKAKKIWREYWDLSKPILLEKSPPHIVRAAQIEQHFDPAFFLIMVRNPYAHCEGLMRRNKWELRRCAKFTGQCLTWQMNNVKNLKHSLHFRYEDLVDDSSDICRRIEAWLPDLKYPLKPHQDFDLLSVDGFVRRKITNLNQRKIDKFSVGQLREISCELMHYDQAMKFWGYNYEEINFRLIADRSKRKIYARLTDALEFLKTMARS